MILAINVIDAVLERIVATDPAKMSRPERSDERAPATGVSGLRRGILVIAVLAGAGIILTSASVFRSLGLSLLASAGVLRWCSASPPARFSATFWRPCRSR